jgi:hypothetical protein
MTPTLLSQAAVVLVLCAPTAALAGPPAPAATEVRNGERPAEAGAEAWSVKPQSAPDWLAFRFQAELGRTHSGGPRLREVSGQVMAGLTPDNEYGVAAEIDYDPAEKKTEFQIFAFGAREVGPVSIEAELGLVRCAGATGWAYTWRLHRPVGESWSAGFEGEGQGPLGHGLEREHFAGPSVILKTPHSPIEFRLGYLFGLNGVGDRAMFGFEVDL